MLCGSPPCVGTPTEQRTKLTDDASIWMKSPAERVNIRRNYGANRREGRRILKGNKAQEGQACGARIRRPTAQRPFAEQSLEGDESREEAGSGLIGNGGFTRGPIERGERQEGNDRGDTERLRKGDILRGV